jgi:5-methyltetrahydrofolate--homocysteine methyltransferase
MTALSDIANKTIRAEIKEFVERPEEIKRLVGLFSQANPVMQAIAATVIQGEHHEADRLTVSALNDGFEALEIMDDGLIGGMGIVGIKFRENFIFVPEVLACARAMKAGMVHIDPILSASGIDPVGKVVMGTVKGDLHDIGKNLCIMMLQGSGFDVIDLGVDVSPDDFIDAIENNGCKLLGMSALLTTTVPNMGRTIEAFIDADLRDDVEIMVGGAPVTQEFADDMGADGYGKDALDCVATARRLLGIKTAVDTGA